MNVIYPPNKVPLPESVGEWLVFLAGSIEMGAAVDWQKQVIESFDGVPVILLNPRRPDWDSSWKQDPKEGPFREQVLWELSSIAKADVVFFYFVPGTISPISLMELGLVIGGMTGKLIGDKKIIVCCPPDFHRYGNVKITCEVAEVKVYEKLEDAIVALTNVVNDRNTTP
jgi:hypothetical protein